MKANIEDAPTPPVGVIESIALGFETVASRLVLVLLPLLLDVFLWMGPRVSFAPAVDSLLEAYHDQVWTPFVVSVNPELDDMWPELSAALGESLGSRVGQYLPVLNLPLLGVPVTMAGREADALPFALNPPQWVVRTPLGMAGAWLVAVGVGLLLGTLYLTLIGQQVRRGRIDLWRVVKRWPANLLWMVLLVILLPVLFVMIYVPFLLVAAGFSLLGGPMTVVAALVDWGGRLLVLWLALYMIFAIHGIIMHEQNLFRALWDSVRVVQWNMSATLLLLLLLVVLSIAMGTVWNLAPGGSWLAVAGIIGNALISTALVTATFVFYKDRYRYWRQVRALLLAEVERRRAQRG